jgi:hypothetical protein
MYIPTWILIIIVLGIIFYYFRKQKGLHPLDLKNNNPTYDEMLKLNEKEFQQWLLIRNETDRKNLLMEMIDHEERTGGLRKTIRKEITPGEQAVLNVFSKEKSAETISALGKLGEIVLEEDKEQQDFVQDAIFAKAASDHVGLGDKMEKERNN